MWPVIALAGIGLCIGLLSTPTVASAYDRYNDGCHLCHGDFRTDPYHSPTGDTWSESLHTTHQEPSFMGSDCYLCHTAGGGFDPWLRSSDGTVNTPGYGCAGCHGSLDPNNIRGYGLREHHVGSGITTCGVCHSGDDPPPPETTSPPYYGIPDTAVDFTCNDDPDTSEDWSGDGSGLDNDGDSLTDGDDPDCGAEVCFDEDGDGFGDPGDESCPSGGETDCDDSDDDVYPGAPELPCDEDDNDCDPSTPDSDDADGDGFSECQDCDDTDPDVHPNASETICDGLDNDCDPSTPDEQDRDEDGYSGCEDCDDHDAETYPGAEEVCDDGQDNDCDGEADVGDPDCSSGDDDDFGGPGDDDDFDWGTFWDEYWESYWMAEGGRDGGCAQGGTASPLGPVHAGSLLALTAYLCARRRR